MNSVTEKLIEKDANNVAVRTRCPFCHKLKIINVPAEGWARWHSGTLIQHAFPTLSASEREALMTGICDDCFP